MWARARFHGSRVKPLNPSMPIQWAKITRKLPLWSNLRAVGNNPATKMTVFIPLIGYMIIFNANILPYLRLASEIFGNPPHFWRLYFIYFGLCSLALGSIIYQFWCPPDIKRFASALDYVTATKNANTGSPVKRKLEEQLGLPVAESNYRALNQGRVWARIFTFVFYFLGFVCLSLPSINVFARVAYSLWTAS
jgi:hypothetical protein